MTYLRRCCDTCSNLNLHNGEVKKRNRIIPLTTPTMQECGGFRKTRGSSKESSKRGGFRVIYLDVPEYKVLYLVLAYPKSEKDSLTAGEKKELRKIAENIKHNLRKTNRG